MAVDAFLTLLLQFPLKIKPVFSLGKHVTMSDRTICCAHRSVGSPPAVDIASDLPGGLGRGWERNKEIIP